MSMYFEQFKKALCIDDSFSLKNLKKVYEDEKAGNLSKGITYESLQQIFDAIAQNQLKSERLIDNSDPLIDDLIRRIDEKIKELAAEKDTDSSETGIIGIDEADEDDNSQIDGKFFITCCKNRDTSLQFKTLFFKTYIYWRINQGWSSEEETESEIPKIDFFCRHYLERDFPSFVLLINLLSHEKSHENKEEQGEVYKKIKAYTKLSIKKIAKSEEYGEDAHTALLFNSQMILFFIMAEHGYEEITEEAINEAISYLAFYLADTYIGKKGSTTTAGLAFAKKGINITDFSCRQDAFNTLGLLAIDAGGQLQLAYDVYYSWIKGTPVGEIKELFTLCESFAEEEKEWRGTTDKGKKSEAIMRGNFAYVCATIGDTYETGFTRCDAFYDIAREQIEWAIALDSEDYRYHCTFGTILLSQHPDSVSDIDKALEQYKSYYSYASTPNEKLTALNHIISTIRQLLVYSYIKREKKNKKDKFNEWCSSDKVQRYLKDLQEEYRKYESITIQNENDKEIVNEIEKKKAIAKLFAFGDFRKEDCSPKIGLILLIIKGISLEIKDWLRRREYSKIDYFTRDPDTDEGINGKREGGKDIAYYTTLKTATYLFDELIQKSEEEAPEKAASNQEGKNCLTVVHAKNMNDPHEGLVLLDSLTQKCKDLQTSGIFPKGSSKLFREKIFDDSFLFLKSFTEQVDNLIMWNRYASDYETDGKNSNGCCIQFDPETFNQIVSCASDNKTLTPNNGDDYYLYRMVYISEDGAIDINKNPGLAPITISLYEGLKSLMTELCSNMNALQAKQACDNKMLDSIGDLLRDSFRFILFLFKADAYSEEVESRLIFTRNHDQQKLIRILPGDPPKLAINPYKQIYINRVIFGPNVRKQEEWKPFLQYKLNSMWAKFEKETGDDTCCVNERYTIDNSIIHYRT